MDGLVTYDVLDNERQKAVCELRRIVDDGMPISILELACTIGTKLHEGDKVSISLCNRLIHLLGGDQPSGIDMLREMDAESDADVTCPNDVLTSSITDELRKWADGDVWSCKWEEFKAIADRIDEQFDRICQQQEAVLQSIIDEVIEERKSDQLRIEKLEKQRDHWHQQATDLMNRADDMERQRDELRHKVDELESFDPETSIAAFGDDNGKLRRTLSRAAALLANAEQDRDANYAYWMDCKEKVVHANATVEELQAKLDAIRDALYG